MADEIFRNMDEFLSADIIHSMKEQMTPSDAAVDSLLAKISAYDASPTSFENTLSFVPDDAPAPLAGSAPKQGRKTSLKPLWRYGSIAVAGVIVLLSAFSLIGDSESSDFKELVDNVLPNHIISDSDSGTAPAGDAAGDEHGDSSLSGSDDSAASADETGDEQQPSQDPSAGKDDNADGNGASTAPAPGDNLASESNNIDLNFSREILAEESVSHLAISGTDYVVDTTATAASTGSEIKAITLKISNSSAADRTVFNAQVKELDNVSSNLMVAVDVDGFKETLIYTNPSYKPSTLGEFVNDAGLDLNVGFSTSVYCKGDKLGYSSYHRFRSDNINELVDTYAFANSSAAPASYSAYKEADTHVTFKTASNPTGSTINFGVSDNGYLYVKMSSGKAFTFNIGTSNATAFISTVTE